MLPNTILALKNGQRFLKFRQCGEISHKSGHTVRMYPLSGLKEFLSSCLSLTNPNITPVSRPESRHHLTNETLEMLYEAYVESLLNNSTDDSEPSPRIDVGTLTNLASFVFSNLDAVTVLGIVSAFEARAKYDPIFRSSFPQFVRRNSWLL